MSLVVAPFGCDNERPAGEDTTVGVDSAADDTGTRADTATDSAQDTGAADTATDATADSRTDSAGTDTSDTSDDTGQQELEALLSEITALRRDVCPPPRSLDQLLPPLAAEDELLAAMKSMSGPRGLVYHDLLEGDADRYVADVATFAAAYRRVADLVPMSWSSYFPDAPVAALEAGAAAGDAQAMMTAYTDINAVCHDCHVAELGKVQHRYTWGDWKTVRVFEPGTAWQVPASNAMSAMEDGLVGTSVDVRQGQHDAARQHWTNFNGWFGALESACSACHDSERRVFVDVGVDVLIGAVDTLLAEAAPDSVAVDAALTSLRQATCVGCHRLHFPGSRVEARWERVSDLCDGALSTDIGELRTLRDALAREAGPPPSELDALFPHGEPSTYRDAMEAMSRALSALDIDAREGDMNALATHAAELRARYEELASVVPAWSDRFPSAPLAALDAAIVGANPAVVEAAVADVNDVCIACHDLDLLRVQVAYEWGDAGAVRVLDPVLGVQLTYARFMKEMSSASSGIGTDLNQGHIEEARAHFEDFQARVGAMETICVACHGTSERRYYIGDELETLVSQISQELAAPSPDAAVIAGLRRSISAASCEPCHRVHMPQAYQQELWRSLPPP